MRASDAAAALRPLFRMRHAPGARLNAQDVAVVGAAAAVSAALRAGLPGFGLWWLPAYGGFGLLVFCNLMRIGTVLEVPWVAAVAASALACFAWDLPPIVVPLAAEPFRLLMGWWAARIGWWRGAGWRHLAARYGHDEDVVARGPRPPFRWPLSGA
jgi:hypothetical protein